jgi:hypothetical protein
MAYHTVYHNICTGGKNEDFIRDYCRVNIFYFFVGADMCLSIVSSSTSLTPYSSLEAANHPNNNWLHKRKWPQNGEHEGGDEKVACVGESAATRLGRG